MKRWSKLILLLLAASAFGYAPDPRLFPRIGQMTSWGAYEANGAPRWNEQLAFGYDAAHNLIGRTNAYMDEMMVIDSRNELADVNLSGQALISGNTPAPATNVTVGAVKAQVYGDLTFASTNAVLKDVSYIAPVVAWNAYGVAVTNNVTVPRAASIALLYDTNGNLTNDSARNFAYDAENRLTNAAAGTNWRTDFVYDGLGRRRVEKDYAWQSGAWNKTNELHFIYDGWLLVQIRDGSNNVLATFTRGLDLSGSRTGAGGIGGLLARTDANGSTYYHSDGEGNVTALIDANQVIQARYLYDPFGRMLGEWGTLAPVNEMQSSSMPKHRQSGLVGYPARFYDPTLQRFLNQDPIGELGGINLYGFVGNSPLNRIDPYGLLGWGDFNPGLLFNSEAWGQLAHDLFHGDDQPPPLDPNSQQALANSAGVGSTPLSPDENGTSPQPGDLVEKTMAGAAVNVLTTALPGAAEEEGAYAAAEKGLKAAEDAAKAAKTVCEKAAKKGAGKPKTYLYQKLGPNGEHLKLASRTTQHLVTRRMSLEAAR